MRRLERLARREDLLYACWADVYVEVARLLVEKGADINKARDTGATPLYICCQEGHLEVAHLLVEKGADVNKARNDGTTPLFTSCQNGHLNIARLLLCHRADPSVMPPSEPLSLTLASLATEEGHPQLAAWLEQCAGWSVWQHVCEARREDLLLKMLVDEELVASCPRRVELLGESVGACGWSCLELAKADNKLLLGVSALPVIVSFLRLVERAMKPWSPDVHLELWPLSFRSGVRQVLLVGGRSRVPSELWLHMLSFCGCDWFQQQVSDVAASKRKRRKTSTIGRWAWLEQCACWKDMKERFSN